MKQIHANSPVTLAQPIVGISEVRKHFPLRRGVFGRSRERIRAVDGISLDILPGETFALVGESGCGKSTLGRLVGGLLKCTSGTIRFQGDEITGLSGSAMRRYRRRMQFVFQDPFASLTPFVTVGKAVREPLENFESLSRHEMKSRVQELMGLVGLRPSDYGRYPHEFSGGQRQRVAIARALALHPDLVICDEPVSALDVSIQAQIINLLVDLRDRYGLSYLFISHDLSVVEHISHRVAVMYLGKAVEVGPTASIFARPLHPYTAALLSARPTPDPSRDMAGRLVLHGEIPSSASPPSGCRFRTRCPIARDLCAGEEPELRELEPSRTVACHFPGEL